MLGQADAGPGEGALVDFDPVRWASGSVAVWGGSVNWYRWPMSGEVAETSLDLLDASGGVAIVPNRYVLRELQGFHAARC
ncbi:MAG: hypothetical protein M3069_25140 [Chloroflexota bacterium]|nr:hypothetical protein [Chloroflexota bacterium]